MKNIYTYSKSLFALLFLFSLSFSYGQCKKPNVYHAKAESHTSVRLQWSSSASSFKVNYISMMGMLVNDAGSKTVGANAVVLTGLKADTSYEFDVQARCSFGARSAFTTVSVRTPKRPCLSQKVTNLRQYRSYKTYGRLYFTGVKDSKYSITSATPFELFKPITTTRTSNVYVTGLRPDSSTPVSVRTICNDGKLGPYAEVRINTDCSQAPIKKFSITNIKHNTARLQYTMGTSSSTLNLVYHVRQNFGAKKWIKAHVKINGTYRTITGLEPSKQYIAYLKSSCNSHYTKKTSSETKSFKFTTIAAPKVCAKATGVVVYNIRTDNAVVKWNRTSGVKYTVEVGQYNHNWGWIFEAHKTYVTYNRWTHMKGLRPDTRYVIRISSTCTRGIKSEVEKVFRTQNPWTRNTMEAIGLEATIINPVKSDVIEIKTQSGKLNYTIHNLVGQEVIPAGITQSGMIGVANLTQGNYILTLTDLKGESKQIKFNKE